MVDVPEDLIRAINEASRRQAKRVVAEMLAREPVVGPIRFGRDPELYPPQRPFLRPVLEAEKPRIRQAIRKALKRSIDR
jgi:hypothetical protein